MKVSTKSKIIDIFENHNGVADFCLKTLTDSAMIHNRLAEIDPALEGVGVQAFMEAVHEGLEEACYVFTSSLRSSVESSWKHMHYLRDEVKSLSNTEICPDWDEKNPDGLANYHKYISPRLGPAVKLLGPVPTKIDEDWGPGIGYDRVVYEAGFEPGNVCIRLGQFKSLAGAREAYEAAVKLLGPVSTIIDEDWGSGIGFDQVNHDVRFEPGNVCIRIDLGRFKSLAGAQENYRTIVELNGELPDGILPRLYEARIVDQREDGPDVIETLGEA